MKKNGIALGYVVFFVLGFIRNEILKKHKIRHRCGYSFANDFKFWTDIAKVGKLANMPEILVHYRTSDTQLTAVHGLKMREASFVIQNEMINYFLSKLNTESEWGKMICRKFLPSLEKMMESGFISYDIYFSFMYELICGLKLKNEIIL